MKKQTLQSKIKALIASGEAASTAAQSLDALQLAAKNRSQISVSLSLWNEVAEVSYDFDVSRESLDRIIAEAKEYNEATLRSLLK